MQSRSYLANDPALIVLYKQLREKTLQTLKGASKIPPRVEWEFVIQNARLYDRMGCDILALDLGTYSPKPETTPHAPRHNHILILLLFFQKPTVRNWEFLTQPQDQQQQQQPNSAKHRYHVRKPSLPDRPQRMLRRRSSLVVDDLPSPGSGAPAPQIMRGLLSPPEKVFEEPDANSLLDSFGF